MGASRKFTTLGELLAESVHEFGNRNAFGTKRGDGSFQWTSFYEFQGLVEKARSGLTERGLGRGDRMALISNNRLEWAVLAFAAYDLGAVIVPMYEAQLPGEWEFIIGDAGVKLVAVSTVDIFGQVEALRERLPSVSACIGFELPAHHPDSYLKLLADGEKSAVPAVKVSPDELAGLIYTSGTTGLPKGVCLTHKNFCSNVHGALERFDFREGDCSLAFLPWAHSFGQTAELYSLLRAGAGLAINDAVPNLIANLPVVKPTVLVAVPRIFNRIYDGVNKQMADKPAPIRKLFAASVALSTRARRGESLGLMERVTLAIGDRLVFSKVRAKFGGRLRFVVSGSAALSPAVGEFIDALGIDVYEGYGLTEASPVISANYPGHRKIGTVGPAFPGVEIEIDRKVTGDPVNGEIVVRGPNVMQGYYGRPSETAEVLREDGALRTGDMGFVDGEGFLHITGRIKEQYKLENGKYVVPSPIEEELKLSPLIANIMVYGENKPHNVALVVLDVPAVERALRDLGQPSSDLAGSAQVKALILAELEKFGKELKSYERPRDVLLITEDFTTENDMLTPKMSLKRRNVMKRYGEALIALYGGK